MAALSNASPLSRASDRRADHETDCPLGAHCELLLATELVVGRLKSGRKGWSFPFWHLFGFDFAQI